MARYQNGEGYEEYDDTADRIARQKAYNRNAGGGLGEYPPSIDLIDDPVELPKPDPNKLDPTTKGIVGFAWKFAAGVVGIVSVFMGGYYLGGINHESIPSGTTSEKVQAGEQVISSATQGDTIAEPPEVKQVAVPDGGSVVGYEITKEGDIKAASASWLDGEGKPLSQEDIKFPWKKEVGMKADVKPIVGVAASGTGKITCTIYRDGRVETQETSEGNSPKVQCGK